MVPDSHMQAPSCFATNKVEAIFTSLFVSEWFLIFPANLFYNRHYNAEASSKPLYLWNGWVQVRGDGGWGRSGGWEEAWCMENDFASRVCSWIVQRTYTTTEATPRSELLFSIFVFRVHNNLKYRFLVFIYNLYIYVVICFCIKPSLNSDFREIEKGWVGG